MQAPEDNIIYQLTNIGASQQPSQQRSPLKTPKASSAGSTPSRDGSITPSPSSRGKKWADRFAKFQRHSDKKRTAHSPSTNRGVSISPVVSQTLSPLGNSHGLRTSSLPRPPDTFEFGLNLTPPPKMGPFSHRRSNTSNKKSFLNEYCTVCDEPILNRGSGERIIELECGHISHQECLLVSFENSGGYSPNDFFSIFPPCTKCHNDKNIENRCIPKNAELKDRLISIFLINGSARRHSEPSTSPTQQLQPPLVLNNFPTLQQTPHISSPRGQMSSQAIPSAQNHALRTPDSILGGMRLASVPPKARKKSAPEIRREWPVPQFQPSIRVSLVLQPDTKNYSVSTSDKLQLYVLRAHYIEILMKNFPTLSDWQIDEEFGLLRLVDHLMMSRDGVDYNDCWCMLFEKALVVAPLADGVKTKQDGSLNVKLKEFHVYKSVANVRVDTVESSVLKWTFPKTEFSSWQEVYVTETLNTDASQVIQKWISALLDHEQEFNDKYFTSTLPLPPIMRNDTQSSHLSTSLMGLITPTKMVELASNERSSVIIRRGFKLSEEQGATLSATGSIQSAMTNISSILSLKRERPDELVVVLQLDFEKIRTKNNSLVIFNSLKALVLKFPDMKICIVDSGGFVRTLGRTKDVISTVEDLEDAQKLSEGNRFEPIWLKNSLYPDTTLKGLGIAIVSNTPMDTQKSCLLKDYSCFTNEGRRRPRELKIKVGYLNLDYSDKVGELVELESWNNFLEALSYSFGLAFGDDDDDDVSSIEEDLTDSENEHPLDDTRSMSSNESTTTILIASPFDASESNARSILGDNEDSHFATGSYSSSLKPSVNSYPQERYREKAPNKNIQDGCDFLLEDIERAIREIDQVSSPSHTESSSHPSVLYQYL
ncbi:ZYRO0C02002p [Zygosaccharomyces rouxii]|uniref:ZYRO0C02002p n=1 Tax=Zygosaccharomyces rouxii (strain ATCC 2623 / CBS 732 / NBRC 1130 / NCYC 568 / NRRL Y-229) TaxID=559307 RepID=C5DSP8_ZYGRC|nr:uncharacterized protein ZYRO0C02002g [Zygosaccharomyces rouxii]KAH9202001.1 kinase Fus3-binding-domain-containing protein [Zygosaccharomyces rouxii]CAR26809.1 ZYRO0C02002p [Zygosaccharomyces rouxii]